MTSEEREKAIDLLDNLLGMIEDNQGDDYDLALKMAIEFLKQEPCEDCVNRQDVLGMMQMRMGAKELYKAVYDLPSVTPERKKGKWIRVGRDKVKCSECEVVHFIAQYPCGTIDYCPNCGARMGSEEV